MAYPIQQNELTPVAKAQLLADNRIRDCFKEKSVQVFAVFSEEIVKYLRDYFLLVNDLRIELGEEYRRSYFDYCFVVVPVHKALECYLAGFLRHVFNFEISSKKTIGQYLGYSDEEKNKSLEKAEEIYWKPTLSKDKWKDRWSALNQEWKTNRNPLTHPEGEKITTLLQAEGAANSIIREMEVSAQLIAKEYFDPLVAYVKQIEESRTKLPITENQTNS